MWAPVPPGEASRGSSRAGKTLELAEEEGVRQWSCPQCSWEHQTGQGHLAARCDPELPLEELPLCQAQSLSWQMGLGLHPALPAWLW